MKHLKRKRKSNYSVRETQTLIREIHKRREVLFSRQQNTAINELKRRAWEEVAGGVNALGEGELRTAAEVKRRYLDWRALMKRKQLRAELLLSSGLKGEYEPSSPEQEASLGSGDQALDLCGFPKEGPCDWQDLADLGEPSGSMTSAGVKMEDEANGYALDEDGGDGEVDDDDCFPTLLNDIDRGEGRVPEVYAHIDEFGMLSASKGAAASMNRDLSLGGLTGMSVTGIANHETTGILVAMEKQRVELEKQRLAVETERLAVERERLSLEKERLRQGEVEKERLQLERERLQLERERLRVLLTNQSERADSSLVPPPQQGPPSSSTSNLDGQMERERERERESRPWLSAADLEAERLRLEKERLQLEKERLQFFKFESGRLQIERERLQVEKERMHLHKDQEP
ncbi:myb/SANT-like DNA-binding domain-containing protein 4 [Osmerus mordax]|uniref:myb/SANT-like DNA-binding domain-containing protein 4 n=1 Tax=Osmerus mordax TaxID=8014 RepID=UPI003510BA68